MNLEKLQKEVDKHIEELNNTNIHNYNARMLLEKTISYKLGLMEGLRINVYGS